ncbi:MAG TPA: hypothetical protein DEA32_01650 [Firmicutes bacterium]|nr:hypothetical protein [Bacillota bacterium]
MRFNFEKKERTSSKERRLEYIRELSDSFDIDEDKHEMLIEFRYDRFSDIFNTSLGRKGGIPLIRNEMMETLERCFRFRPIGYSVRFDFVVSDLEGHTVEEAEKCFVHSISLGGYVSSKEGKGKTMTALVLTIVGILILVFTSLCTGLGWVDVEGATWKIMSEVLDIAAWVFIWEAVTIYFIDRPERKLFIRNFKKSLTEVTFREDRSD